MPSKTAWPDSDLHFAFGNGVAGTDVRRTRATKLPGLLVPANYIMIDLLHVLQTCGKASKRRSGETASTLSQ